MSWGVAEEMGNDFEGAGEPRLVLVVDDDACVRSLLARAVSLCGHRAVQAGDGAEALEVVARFGPAIAAVLSDVRMPFIDGKQLARELLATYPAIPVALITSRDINATDELHNVKHVILKPFTVDALLEKLDDMLAAR